MTAPVPVQPVALRFSEDGALSANAPFVGDDALLPHLLRLLRAKRIEVDVAFAAPIDPRGHDRRSLARATQAVVARALADLPALGPGRIPNSKSPTHRYRRDPRFNPVSQLDAEMNN